MKFIANILTINLFSDNELYNVVSKKEDLVKEIPTLVIGWEFTKKMYPNANILEWEIEDNVYWTFGKRERRERFDDDIIRFRELALKKFINSVEYDFISVLTSMDDEKSELCEIINGNKNATAYIYNDMIYLNNENKVYGVSLKDIEYEGKDKKKIFSKIYGNPSIRVIEEINDLSMDMRNALRNFNYIVPYLYS